MISCYSVTDNHRENCESILMKNQMDHYMQQNSLITYLLKNTYVINHDVLGDTLCVLVRIILLVCCRTLQDEALALAAWLGDWLMSKHQLTKNIFEPEESSKLAMRWDVVATLTHATPGFPFPNASTGCDARKHGMTIIAAVQQIKLY